MSTDDLLHSTYTIIKSVIRPVAELACVAWHASLTEDQSARFESIQHRALELIYGRDNDEMKMLPSLAVRREDVAKRYFNSLIGVQSKRRQTETATVKTATRRNDDKPKRRQQFSDFSRQPKRRHAGTTTTSRNDDKPTSRNDDTPKRRQTETTTSKNDDKPKRRHAETTTSKNDDKPKCRHAETTTNLNGDNNCHTTSDNQNGDSQNDDKPEWQL